MSEATTTVLAGDIGGTGTRLSLFHQAADGTLSRGRTERFRSRQYEGLEPIVDLFLESEVDRPRAAAFGIAGPVVGNSVKTTNLAWHIEGGALARSCGIPRVHLLNDLVATAEGIPALPPAALLPLQEGEPEPGTHGILLAAGTGLGMTILARMPRRAGEPGDPAGDPLHDDLLPIPSEGGHADFAPRNEEEIGLLRFLQARHGRVSVERVVSGPGLKAIFDYLMDVDYAPVAHDVLEEMVLSDPSQVIAEAGATGRCRLCARALERFVSCYGAVAGNLALTALARGGVWIGGGIAPKIREVLARGGFLQAFLDKGRFRGLLERMPVQVVLDPDTALLGAARHAASLVRGVGG